MHWFILRKLAVLVATVLVTAMFAYGLLATAPGAVPDSGLLGWLGHALVGDFGQSSAGGAVGALIAPRLGVTAPLALLAIVLTAIMGFGLGYAAALRPGSIGDRALGALSSLGAAAPNFWLGMVLVLLFAMVLRWLPSGGFVPWQDNAGAALLSLILPALALALPAAAALALSVRDALAAARGSTYVQAAQARGLTARAAMARHGLRPALLPIIDALVVQCAMIIAGTVIVETVFYLPGLGRLILDAVGSRDLAVVRAGLVVLVLLISAGMFLTSLLAVWVDPRLRAGRSE
ncbi:MAG: ABC transporter permease [Devosia sp.]